LTKVVYWIAYWYWQIFVIQYPGISYWNIGSIPYQCTLHASNLSSRGLMIYCYEPLCEHFINIEF